MEKVTLKARLRVVWSCWVQGFKHLVNRDDDPEGAIEWVLDDVMTERLRQIRLWGHQEHPDHTGPGVKFPNGVAYSEMLDSVREINDTFDNPHWDSILLEEVLEALVEEKPRRLRRELIQTAAVCASWVQDLDSRGR